MRLAAIGLVLMASFAGCVGDGATERGGPSAFADGEHSTRIVGLVLDPELLPVPDVHVVVQPDGGETSTDAGGHFNFTLAESGVFTLVLRKLGYAEAVVEVRVAQGEISEPVVTMEPTALDVPYHKTELFTTYTDCWLSVLFASVPCIGFIDYVAGTSLAGDSVTYDFNVENPGLANLLVEVTWEPQTTGHDAIIVVREPGSLYSGAQASFLLVGKADPIRTWMYPDVVNEGGEDPFVADPSIEYMALVGGWTTNNTVPEAALHLSFRTDDALTFFHNRPGSSTFTALPDA